MEKSIIIAGAGMGGLAAGVYGRLNGYRTAIFEQHSLPGGQCASTHGFLSGPAKEFNPNDMMFGKGYSTVPGLSNFFMIGTWATSTGALFANALSGRKAVKTLCKADGKRFATG